MYHKISGVVLIFICSCFGILRAQRYSLHDEDLRVKMTQKEDTITVSVSNVTTNKFIYFSEKPCGLAIPSNDKTFAIRIGFDFSCIVEGSLLLQTLAPSENIYFQYIVDKREITELYLSLGYIILTEKKLPNNLFIDSDYLSRNFRSEYKYIYKDYFFPYCTNW